MPRRTFTGGSQCDLSRWWHLDARRLETKAGFAMFHTKTVESMDRTGLNSEANDVPTERSTSHWARPSNDVFGATLRVRTGRRLFVSAELSRGINGTNTSLTASTPGRFILTSRTLLVDSAPFDGQSVDAGTQNRRISQGKHHANNRIRHRREYAPHAFADRHRPGHARVSQGPIGVALPFGPWEFDLRRFCRWPLFSMGSC